MIKVTCFTGTRADYPRIRPVLELLEADDRFDLSLVITGQHLLNSKGYTASDVYEDAFRVLAEIPIFTEGQDSLEADGFAFSNAVVGLTQVLTRERPDIALITVDRLETLAIASVCSVLQIFSVHVQGGELSGTQDEIFRHAITKLTSVHCAASRDAANRLVRMGESPSDVATTGCPYSVYLSRYRTKPMHDLSDRDNIIVAFHGNPHDLAESQLFEKSLSKILLELPGKRVLIMSPNTDLGNSSVSEVLSNFDFEVFPNLDWRDYLTELSKACLIVGNSSSGIRKPLSRRPLCFSWLQTNESRKRPKCC